MLRFISTAALCLAGTIGTAAAQSCSCPTTGSNQVLQQNDLRDAFAGRQVCAVVNGEIQQELHQGTAGVSTSGNVKAYKLGPSSTMDPSKVVGTWSVTGSGSNAKLQYNYLGGAVYPYSVCQLNATGGGTYCFVNSALAASYTVTRLTNVLGTGEPVQCPGAPSAAAAARGPLR